MSTSPSSPRFVLVRGLAREASHWHDFDAGLLAHYPGATVERHDLPGNGEHWRETSPLSTAGLAEALRERVLAADPRPPVLVAISLGAMVCLEWLRRWPQDPLAGLAVINTSVGGLCPPWQRLRIPALVHTLATLAERDPIAREQAILDLTTSQYRDDRALAELQAAFHRARPIRRVNVLRQMVAAAGFRLETLETQVSILILNSLADRMVDARCSRRLAAAIDAQLVVHPDAGHDLTLDDPRWCGEVIARWLGSSRSSDEDRPIDANSGASQRQL